MSSTAQAPERPGFFKLWFMAARPKTLTATLAPISVGTSLAVLHDAFAPLAMVMALLGALCIQIGTNYANDLFDAKKGTDDEERRGHTLWPESLFVIRAHLGVEEIVGGVGPDLVAQRPQQRQHQR
ncbi:MAG: hypothetical protein AAGI01_17340, partial [Myxococcota bacterium]